MGLNELSDHFYEMYAVVLGAFTKLRFSAAVRVEFYRTLILLYRNNSSLLDALNDITANYSDDGKKRFNPVALAAMDCAQAVQNGEKLTNQLQYWVPEQEAQVIAAGELSGNLAEGLRRAIEAVQQSENVRKAMQKVIYPAGLMLGIGYLLNQVSTVIVPQMVKMGNPDTWTFEGRILKLIADIVLAFGMPGAISLVALIVAILITLPYFKGPIRVFLDRIPPWSLYQDIKGADFLLQITMLQSSSTSLEEALSQVSEMSSPWMRERVDAISVGVANGLNLGEALEKSGYNFPNRSAIRYLRTIAGKEGSKRSIEQFARDWNVATLERVDRWADRSVNAGVIVFYGIVFLIWSCMNGVMNTMMTSMPGM